MREQVSRSTQRIALIKIVALVCALVLSIALVGCGADKKEATQQKGSSQGVPAAGQKFIVGFDQNFPPFGYVDDKGEYTGFDLEIAQAVCKKLGWEYVAQPINWDAKNAELDAGTISCIWNGFSTTGRQDGYTMTRPYLKNNQIVVVKESSGIKKLSDLKGKQVQVQTDSAALELFETKYKDLASTFTMTTVGDYNTAFLNLEAGACDAVAMDSTVARYQINGRSGFVILDEPLSEEDYAVAFKLGNTELRDKVEGALVELYKDGTIPEISKKYFGSDQWLIKDNK